MDSTTETASPKLAVWKIMRPTYMDAAEFNREWNELTPVEQQELYELVLPTAS